MNAPQVSVIIPTYNRRASLCRTLATLAQQALSVDAYEVVVVDDGSTDDTAQVANAAFAYRLRYHRQANQGSAAARNAGAELAAGRFLVFLDDDMRAEPGYLPGLLAEHRTHARIVGMGTERLCAPDGASIYGQLAAVGRWPAANEFVDFTACVTNNLSVAREDFFAIGGMQDVAGDGPTWWGDVDFGYRAAQLGFRFRRSAAAICWHCDYSMKNLRTAAQRAEKISAMAHHLFRKHPGIERYLPMFADKAPVDWRADSPRLIVRKLARQAASTRPALAALEQAASVLEAHYPRPALRQPVYRWVIGGHIYRGYRRGRRSQAAEFEGKGV